MNTQLALPYTQLALDGVQVLGVVALGVQVTPQVLDLNYGFGLTIILVPTLLLLHVGVLFFIGKMQMA